MNQDKELKESVDLIAKNTLAILERVDSIEKRVGTIENNMVSKLEFNIYKQDTQKNFNDLNTDLKSFKEETRDEFKGLNEKVDELMDTSSFYDKRFEKIEEKVFA